MCHVPIGILYTGMAEINKMFGNFKTAISLQPLNEFLQNKDQIVR